MERLTDTQLRQLAKAAQAAAKREGDGVWKDGDPREELGRLVTSDGRRAVADYAWGETRIYMAAASPAAVLALVIEVQEMRKAVAAADLGPLQKITAQGSTP